MRPADAITVEYPTALCVLAVTAGGLPSFISVLGSQTASLWVRARVLVPARQCCQRCGEGKRTASRTPRSVFSSEPQSNAAGGRLRALRHQPPYGLPHRGCRYETNQFVQCDQCNVMVHMECYGVPKLPDGELWLCRSCEYGLTVEPPCVVCPHPVTPIAQGFVGCELHDVERKEKSSSRGRVRHAHPIPLMRV
jgi:hypothetical protein